MPRETAFPEPLPGPPARPRRRWPWVLAAVVGLPVLAGGIFLAGFDLNGQKPRIQAAVKQATGRDLTLDGPIGVKFSLVPTLTVEGAALANMPGGSRPQMATVQRVELELALLPLLSRQVEVRRLRLVAPDILLETDAAGRPNWVFDRPAPPDAAPAPMPEARPAEAVQATERRLHLSVGRVAVEAGRVTWRDGRTGATRTLGIPGFEVAADGERGPVRGKGNVTLDGAPISLEGESGPLLGLTRPLPGTPWPVRLTLAAAGASATLEGSIDRPQERRGWKAVLTAAVPDTQALVPLLPDLPLPPLRDIRARVGLADAGPGQQALTALDVSIGASPLDPLLPGLALAGLRLTQAGPEAPLAVEGTGTLRDVPVTLKGSTGSPMVLRPGSQGAMPVDLVATAAGATATVKGTIGDPRRIGDVALLVAFGIPDLAALSPLAGTPLPAVKDLTIGTALAERGFGFSGGAFLKGLRIASSAGDAEGELTYVIGMRQGLHGRLASRRLDLDSPGLPADPAAAGAPAVPAAPPAPPARRDGRVIPEVPLPLELLRVTDSDLRWTIGELRSGGVTLRDTTAHLAIADGRGRLDPFTTTLPGGHLSLRAAADVTTTPPSLQVAAQSEGIDLATLLAALHAPGGTAGRLEFDLDLRGQGRDLRAVAATATGHAGLALTDGQVDSGSGSLLGRALGDLRQAVPQLGALAEGRVTLACAATRWRAEAGIARAETLLLDGSLGKVGGGGQANLRDETLALRLQLDLRLPIPGVSQLRIRAPLAVGGSFANPRPDYGPALTRGAIGTVEGLAQLPGGVAGEILGALGGNGGTPSGGLPDCGAALAVARGGRAGPVPAAGPSAAPAPAERVPAPLKGLPGPAQDLLRGLLRGR
ncbi:AsmA family protein [Dankookia sp. GCM10030260]|uniref:AsmA family protein n=1 Tax=Dankookia sp. GCM10030260 TaxID=3273390 RepID=UPI003606DD29